jgi:hypothetical protein
MSKSGVIVITIVAALVVLMGCSRSHQSQDAEGIGTGDLATKTAAQARALPTLYPTATDHPTALPTDTRQPIPTSPQDTPVAYDQHVVDLRYSIPAIGLERTLSGDVSGRLTLTDETSGIGVERRNQAGILLEMQQSLPRITLDELPEECEHCVWIEYSLPLTGDQDQGWLQDARMLASIENFTTTILGPHLPPGSIAALRRSATQDQVAHTVALTGDGMLWRWKATDAEIPLAVAVEDDDPILTTVFSNAALLELAPLYAAACPDKAGVETLFVTSGNTGRYIDLFCPELALPTTLLPLYLSLDAKTVGIMEPADQESYKPPLPQETLIYFRNAEGLELTVYYDGRTFATDSGGIVFSNTMTMTLAISLTTSLLESGVMQQGVEDFLEGSAKNILIIRGPDGLYEQTWNDAADERIQPVVETLNRLANRLLSAGKEVDTDAVDPSNLTTPLSTPPATGTQSPGFTPTPS